MKVPGSMNELNKQFNSPVTVENHQNIKIIENLDQTKEDLMLPSSPSQHIESTTYRDLPDHQYMANLYQRFQQDEVLTLQE